MSARKMLPFILINVVVSAVVVLSILYFWEGQRGQGTVAETAVTPLPPTPNLIVPSETDGQETVENSEEPVEEEGPTVHVVRTGDTLGTISQIYGVTIDDIVLMNELQNPNVLSVGQELIIPINGIPTATPEPTEEPAPTVIPDPIATEALEFGDNAVVEITAVVTPGELETEAIQIINSGTDPIALLDWQIKDALGQTFTFGQVTLFGEGAGILVHTTSGQNGASDVYWGRQEAVWQPGSIVTLYDATGTEQASYIVP